MVKVGEYPIFYTAYDSGNVSINKNVFSRSTDQR